MNLKQLWKDKYPRKDENSEFSEPNSVYDVAISPDGSRIIVGAGSKVLLYETLTGNIIKVMKNHKDVVNTVAYNYDGRLMASGSKDKLVIVWNEEGKGILKFSHSASLQRARFCPVNNTLLTACSSELCLCQPEKKKVDRIKISSRVRSMSWTLDGSM